MTKRVTENTETAVAAVVTAETNEPVLKQDKAEEPGRVEQQEEVQKAREKVSAVGFYCYIGPNLKKLIQTGTIFRGSREEALAKADAAIQAEPLVKTLIVYGDVLPKARVQVRTPGNVLYANYRKLAGKEKRNG